MHGIPTVRRLVLGGAIVALGAFLPARARAQTSDTGMARTTTTTTRTDDDNDDGGKLGLLGLLGLAGLLGMRRREPTVVHRDATVRDTTVRDTTR
jgi:MYXO-CTERM domain-containing protein